MSRFKKKSQLVPIPFSLSLFIVFQLLFVQSGQRDGETLFALCVFQPDRFRLITTSATTTAATTSATTTTTTSCFVATIL